MSNLLLTKKENSNLLKLWFLGFNYFFFLNLSFIKKISFIELNLSIKNKIKSPRWLPICIYLFLRQKNNLLKKILKKDFGLLELKKIFTND